MNRLGLRMVLLALAGSLLLLIPNTWADNSGQALQLTMDARTASMASATTALSGDASSLWNNPAGLTALRSPQVGATFRNELVDVSSGNLVFGYPLNEGSVLSLGIFSLYGGTVELDDGSSAIAEMDVLIALAYAQDLSQIISLPFPVQMGLTGKYLHSALAGGFTQQGFAGDIGVIVPWPDTDIHFGAAVRNLGPPLTFDLQSDPLPTTLSVGVAWLKDLAHDWHLTLTVDSEQTANSPWLLLTGMEWAYADTLYVRGGYRFFHDTDSFSLGMGVRTLSFGLDYAYLANSLSGKSLVTVEYAFDSSAPANPRKSARK